jgi:ABC-type sugar transport system substrate-binding protein
MRSKITSGALVGLLLVAVTAIVLAGCGGGDDSTSSSGTETTTSEGTDSGGGADVAAAKKILAPYVGQYYPEFPVEEALKEKPDPNTRISALQESSSIGGLLVEILEGAAKVAGVQLSVVKAGTTATTAQAAAETVVTQDPEAFYLPPFEPSTISKQLNELDEAEIPVITTGGGADTANYPAIIANQVPPDQFESYGEIFAAWAVQKNGDDTNVVLIEHPEYSFSAALKTSFLGTMEKLCPDCEADVLPISFGEAAQAPNRIVSELQANPDINQVVAISDFTKGLPAAMKAAQLDVGTFVYPGEPQTFEYIKNGEIEAALSQGLGTQSFTVMDIALRAIQGQPLTAAEEKGWQPMQILEQKDMTFDTKLGWEPEPDYVEKFAEYWHAK